MTCSGNRHLREKKHNFRGPHRGTSAVAKARLECQLSNTKVVHELNFRSLESQSFLIHSAAPARKSQPFSSKVAREARFRSSSSQPLPAHERTRCLMSGNWRGGPSTFAKLSRILRQTFAKIRLEVPLNLTRKLQNSHKTVSAGWGLLLQRRILAATLRLRIPRPTLVCGHSARTASKYTRSHPYRRISARREEASPSSIFAGLVLVLHDVQHYLQQARKSV